ncbi:MAG: 50S ribosomal protein L9 [Chloroflexota bacterium]|nr:50S ribosomal protein L9 [Chloroflexota bacterium]
MATKVILTQDVEHLGAAGTVQTVKEGFARNYLLPKRLAEIATTGTIKQVQERQAAVERRIRKQEEELRSLGDKIAATTLTFTARVGENGRLFGSITAQEIADALSRAVGEDVDRRKVALDEPIRSIGEHKVSVRLVGRLVPSVTVVVVGEGGETAEETAPAADAQPDQPEPPEA